MTKKRILIVEDEQDMAELVSMRLTREGYATDVAYDGPDGLKKAQSSRPDLVLLDLMLPGMPGTDVLKELRGDPETARIPVIVLTARSEESDIVVGLHVGADDYVTKPFSMSVLMARIGAVMRRSDTVSEPDKGVLTAGPIRINQDTHHVEVYDKKVTLTLTEFRLLLAIVSTKGRVLSRNQLIDRAIGMDAVVTDRTIDVHLTALRRKLGKARKYIQTVRGLGYRLALDENEKT